MSTLDKARELQRLHADPELLLLVNVWDVITARVVADTPGTTALATASHSVAAAYGYPDGEQIPRDLMIEAVGRIAAAVDLPVTADLEAGYGDPGGTIERAIDVGVVGANLEDQLKPLPDAVRAVEEAVAAGRAGRHPVRAQRPHRRLPPRRRPGPRRGARRRDRARPGLPRRRRLDVLRPGPARRADRRGPGRGARAAEGQPHRRPRVAAARDAAAAGRGPGLVRPVEPERRPHRAGRPGRGRPRRRRHPREHPQLN